ncbi:MAG TPA: hypothetical protein VG326_18820 [Tepidisphaeraceae bacterium]|nr:hypothetical protein [Tepidisphaeraceae bacterium]
MAFIAGLLVTIWSADRLMGLHLKKIGHRGGLGAEVQNAITRVSRLRPDIHTILLGDSVSHQLFKPGSEGRSDILFLTTNQAISAAGQCYLAELAMDHCPALGDIYLFYLPASWGNNLPPDLTHDYLCGHFHQAGQVIEVLKVKRDFQLSFAHAGRWLMPNLMAANSLSRPAFSLAPTMTRKAPISDSGTALPPADPERLMTQLSEACAPAADPQPAAPPGCRAVTLSPVSRYYLSKLRRECHRRGVSLHVLPCPVSDEKNGFTFVDTQGIYEAPIIGDFPAEQLIDGIHFKRAFVQGARDRIVRDYGLKFLMRP